MSLERREIRIVQPRAPHVSADGDRFSNDRFQSLAAQITSRFLTREDIPAICGIERQSYSNPWSDPFIASEFDKDVSFRPAIFLNDELVGYSFNYIVVDELHILNLAIHPRLRRMGLGALLLSEILEGGATRGCSFATLEVRVGNIPARRMYERFGFCPVSVRRGYYSDNGEDALILDRAIGTEKGY